MFPAQANVYRIMLEMLDVLEAMIPEWDGKVINKRFVTAFGKRFDANRGRLSMLYSWQKSSNVPTSYFCKHASTSYIVGV